MIQGASMFLKRILARLRETSGMYVIRNLDGEERRFASPTSSLALEWQRSGGHGKPLTKSGRPVFRQFSQEWWDEKEFDPNWKTPTPRTKVSSQNDGEEIERIVRDQMGHDSVYDWNVTSIGMINFSAVSCATATVRVYFELTEDDDLGVSGNDTLYIQVRRDIRDPQRLVFVKFVG